jgi:hypothetical protein
MWRWGVPFLLSTLTLGVGCDHPQQISVGPPTAISPQYGGTGGAAFDEACPEHQVAIGVSRRTRPSGLFEPTYYTYFPTCGTPLVPPHGADETRVPISIEPGDGHGSPVEGCPPDEVVVAVDVSWDRYVNSLSLQCASLYLGQDAAGQPTIGMGSITTVPAALNEAGPTDRSDHFSCPSGQAVTSLFGRSAVLLDAFGMTCASLGPPS